MFVLKTNKKKKSHLVNWVVQWSLTVVKMLEETLAGACWEWQFAQVRPVRASELWCSCRTEQNCYLPTHPGNIERSCCLFTIGDDIFPVLSMWQAVGQDVVFLVNFWSLLQVSCACRVCMERAPFSTKRIRSRRQQEGIAGRRRERGCCLWCWCAWTVGCTDQRQRRMSGWAQAAIWEIFR